MAWLRLDDGFTKHPKFEGWTRDQRWSWLEVMEYCAKYRTGGRIPTDETLLPRSATRALLAKAEAARWCYRGKDGALWIKDWDEYNPPADGDGDLDERVKQALNNHPDASANELARMVGGRRKPALAAIRRFRNCETPGSDDGSGNHTGTGSRAGSRPVPSPNSEKPLATEAAAGTKSTSSSTESHYDEPNPEDQENPAAVQAAATEQDILAACTRFGAEPNIAEPWARQLTGDELAAIVVKMEMKIRRGTVEHPPAQFVDLMQRQVRANVKKASAVTIHIPTLEENLHDDAVQYARGHHPWDVASELLARKMTKLDVPAERQAELLPELRRAYDESAAAA